MKINIITSALTFITLFSCNNLEIKDEKQKIETTIVEKPDTNKIDVLNVGTFHFGYTLDAKTVDFDENGNKEQLEIRELNELLSVFTPTIICVEIEPVNEKALNKSYQEYLQNSEKMDSNWGEISLVAFEIARMNNIDKIYAIDHRMGYNYNIGEEIINSIDSLTYRNYVNNPFENNPELNTNDDDLSLLEKIRKVNNPDYQDFLLNINADILTYVGTDGNFEGADEATKLYQRNLRMFSNINRIPMNKEDRVFILSGGLHASYFNEFMSRSPKYNIVNIYDYLGNNE